MQYPNIKVTANNQDISSVVMRFEYSSGLYGGIDSVILLFRDIENVIAPSLSAGQTIIIQWGYDENYDDLFEGVITNIHTDREDVLIKALDYSVGFNSSFISQTFIEETASNILSSILIDSGLTLEIEQSDFTYKVFPIFNESAFSVLQKVTKDISDHTAVPQIFYTRGKSFIWKALDTSISPVMEFTTGDNIIEWVEGRCLTTLIVPVFIGDVVTINESDFLVESASYRWETGGRTVLGVSGI